MMMRELINDLIITRQLYTASKQTVKVSTSQEGQLTINLCMKKQFS